MNIDVRGIDKAELLVALFTAANPPIGRGALNYSAYDTLTYDEATEILKGETFDTPYSGQPMHVDYVKGRNLKIDLSGDEIDPTKYNAINGDLTAQRAIDDLGYKSPTGLMPSGRSTNNEDVIETSPDGTEWVSYSGASDLHYAGPDDLVGYYMP